MKNSMSLPADRHCSHFVFQRPPARRWLALPVIAACLMTAGGTLHATTPIGNTGTGYLLNATTDTVYTIAPGILITDTSATNKLAAITDTVGDTASWHITNSGSIGWVNRSSAPYNGIFINSSGTTTVINEASGFIKGWATSEARAGVRIGGYGIVKNHGWIEGAQGVRLSYGGEVLNTGTIIGAYFSGVANMTTTTTTSVRNEGGFITGTAVGVLLGGGGELYNTGTIIGQTLQGVYTEGTLITIIRNTGAGSIIGYDNAVHLATGGIAEVYNTGGALIDSGTKYGLQTGADTLVVNDASTIRGATRGVNYANGSGTVRNINGALIETTGNGSGIVSAANVSLFIENDASTINAAGSGILFNAATASGTVQNRNGGEIIGGAGSGILSLGALVEVENNASTILGSQRGMSFTRAAGGSATVSNINGAVISGSSDSAIFSNLDLWLNNDGLITGGSHGVYLGASGTITNTGTIRSGGAAGMAAVYFSATAPAATGKLTLGTGSVLEGDVISAKAVGNTIDLAGTGFEDANFTGTSADTGFESLTMNGSLWTLSGTVSITGVAANSISINSGTLSLTGALSTPGGAGVAIADSSALSLGFASDAVFAAPISGDGSLTHAGAGLLDLTGANTYGGTTTIESGTLRGSIGNSAALHFSTTTATYISTNATVTTLASAITGTGNLIHAGTGLLTLTGANTYAGQTTVLTGTLAGAIGSSALHLDTTSAAYIVDPTATSVTLGNVTGVGILDIQNAALVFDVAASSTQTYGFAGTLESNNVASNKLIKTGAGTFVLTQSLASSLAGETEIREGTFSLSDAAFLNAAGITLGSDAGKGFIEYTGAGAWTSAVTLAGQGGGFNVSSAVGTGTQTLSVAVNGAGTFAKTGDGTLDVRGATFAAGVTGVDVSGGGQLIGNQNSLKGNIVLSDNSTIIYEHNAGADHEHTGLITGDGNLIKTGDGLLELTGANNYTGNTTINSGTLQGRIGLGILTVLTGATYKVADGETDFALGGIMGGGTIDLNAAGLTFDVAAGVSSTFSFNGTLISSDPNSALIKTGLGTLELGSVATLSGGVQLKEGILKLANQSFIQTPIVLGTATTSGLIEYTGAAPWAHTVTLAAGGGGGFSVESGSLALSSTIAGPGNFVKGGAGTLDITGATITDMASGTTQVLDGVLRVNTAKVKTAGIDLAAATSVIEFHQTDSGTYSGVISGAGALLKTGNGALVLDNTANAYGDTTIAAGLLEGRIGTGMLTVEASGTYKVAAGVAEFAISSVSGAGTIDMSNADLVLDVTGGTSQYDFAGTLTGGGRFIKTGAGTLELLKSVALADGAQIQDGVVRLADQAFINAPIVLGTATTSGLIEYTGATPWAHVITLAEGGGGGFEVASGTLSLNSMIGGAGNFVKAGAGTLDIIGATVSDLASGTMQVLDGALRANTATAKTGGIDLAAATSVIEFNQTDSGTYAGVISGPGALLKTGDAALMLANTANNYGDTVIRAGLLEGTLGAGTLTVESSGTYKVAASTDQFSTAGVLGDGTIDMSNADLVLDVATGTTVYNFAGTLVGGNQFIKTGAGTVELLASVALTNGAQIQDGVVTLANQNFLNAPIVLGTATTSGLIDYTGAQAWTREITLSGSGGGFHVGSGATTIAATISSADNAPLIKAGAGVLDITGATLSGVDTADVLGGVLRGNAASMPAGVAVASGASVEFFETGSASYAGTVNGAGSLIKSGSGTLIMTGALAHTGETFITGGVLKTSAANFWQPGSAVTIGAGSAMDIGGGPDTGAFNQSIASLTNNGSIYINASVNSRAGSIEWADSLTVTGTATGSGKVLVHLHESAVVTTSTTAVIMQITAGDASNYEVGLDKRTVSGPYEWTVSKDAGIVTLALGELSPEVAAAGALDASSYLVGKASFAAIGQRLMGARSGSQEHEFNLWTNGQRREDTLTSDLYDGAEARTENLQFGADWNFSKISDRPLTLGVFYDYAKSDIDMPAGLSATSMRSQGMGAYVSYRTQQLYVDAILRNSKNDFEVSVPYTGSFKTEGASMAAAIEVGGCLVNDSWWNVEPQAQFVYQRHTINDIVDGMDRAITVECADSVEARAGVRVWRLFELKALDLSIIPHVRASFAYELNGKGTVTFVDGMTNPATGEKTDVVFNNAFGGSSGMIDGGVALEWKRGFRLQADGAWYTGDRMRGYSLQISAGFVW